MCRDCPTPEIAVPLRLIFHESATMNAPQSTSGSSTPLYHVKCFDSCWPFSFVFRHALASKLTERCPGVDARKLRPSDFVTSCRQSLLKPGQHNTPKCVYINLAAVSA
mmetsp:Transcript_64569/g.124498  ORF Transcript_64569/g.124498 Transcript_64569/m.124498 type:complete len:108 (-) Transcript_64569:1676-1999(-)